MSNSYRCYLIGSGSQYKAVCADLNLTVTADSAMSAMASLKAHIKWPDKSLTGKRCGRPWVTWLTYWALLMLHKVGIGSGSFVPFRVET